MKSSMVSKVEKARRYAQEPSRLKMTEFKAIFSGDHSTYEIKYENGIWHCSCAFFVSWKICSHTMASQRILSTVLPEELAIDAKHD